jgi:hypothetical protein
VSESTVPVERTSTGRGIVVPRDPPLDGVPRRTQRLTSVLDQDLIEYGSPPKREVRWKEASAELVCPCRRLDLSQRGIALNVSADGRSVGRFRLGLAHAATHAGQSE